MEFKKTLKDDKEFVADARGRIKEALENLEISIDRIIETASKT